jgi:hypothetical protein
MKAFLMGLSIGAIGSSMVLGFGGKIDTKIVDCAVQSCAFSLFYLAFIK